MVLHNFMLLALPALYLDTGVFQLMWRSHLQHESPES